MIFEKIKTLAEQNGITIAALEKVLGFGNGTIRAWRKRTPSADNLKKVADYFKKPIEYFLS